MSYPSYEFAGLVPEVSSSTGRREAIAGHLRGHAASYYEEFQGERVRVDLVCELQRSQSVIYRFAVGAAGRSRRLIVKVPSRTHRATPAGTAAPGVEDRPRIFPVADLESRSWTEYSALSAIGRHIDAIRDPRFGAVRALDCIAGLNAVVMEDIGDPTLRTLFARGALWWPGRTAGLEAAFANAGAWLRAYHAAPCGVERVNATPSEFVDSIWTFARYLSESGDHAFFDRVAADTSAAALDVLPESLPLGVRHGDYSLRNVLVGKQARVTVLDTLAHLQTAVYYDVAYFLTGFKLNRPQVLSQGWAFDSGLLRRCEDAFLGGYFGGGKIPFRILKLYEIQTLLDKWTANEFWSRQRSTVDGNWKGACARPLVRRYFRSYLRSLVRGLESL
jgi:hypothetical protein